MVLYTLENRDGNGERRRAVEAAVGDDKLPGVKGRAMEHRPELARSPIVSGMTR
jgi:hypothetical protein